MGSMGNLPQRIAVASQFFKLLYALGSTCIDLSY